ncbi:MAG TPA: glycine cleavage system protein GcvH [Candidatus Bathyarchaeia archaeon]|nr:glycine cleavage system protein GcvH [Candidatus Bathyarchaeia archaeon]
MRYQDYELPDDLLYSREHEWVRLAGKEAVVGITDYAQKQLHEIVYVEVKDEGSEVEQNQSMGTVESVKSVSDVFSPVTGKITKVNRELGDSPELLNQDPYGKGWLARISLVDLKKDKGRLLTAEQYAQYLKTMEE